MATYTINIDERTIAGKSLLNYLRAIGILLDKTRENEAKGKSATLQAIKDAEEGRITRYASFDDFKRAMNEI